jgi:Cu(I)/Ag(I) efflux system membrane protein CusA/SilA
VAELREAILDGAIHRLRPKLLTEGTTIISIAPMLWASGVGAEVVRPMAAPVLGGLLIADEVIDVFLPVLYFAVKKWEWRKIHRVGLFERNGQVTSGVQELAVPVGE